MEQCCSSFWWKGTNEGRFGGKAIMGLEKYSCRDSDIEEMDGQHGEGNSNMFQNDGALSMRKRNRGCSVDPKCAVCGFKNEDAAHLFLQCWWAVEFWRDGFGGTCTRYDTIKKVWTFIRCDAVMKGKATAREFSQVDFRFVVSQSDAENCWRPLDEEGSYKISCDGSLNASLKIAGVGIVCRDSKGVVTLSAATHTNGRHDGMHWNGTGTKRGLEESHILIGQR
ncbi:hypothetical protein QQ045_007487 [Rhodiola kirilowii]